MATSLDIVINGRDRASRAVRGVERALDGFRNTANNAAAALAAYFGAVQITRGFQSIVTAASDAEEAASKFGFVFGSAISDTQKKLDAFAKAAGRSKFELRAMAADVGALIRPMGFTEDATSKMSVQLVKLAQDLSSFFNATEEEALTALRAGLVGESEPLRRFGVQLNAARIETEALAMGLAKTKDEITPAIKAQAILALVMKDTAGAQGDAIRTADSYANQVRRLTGQWQDFKVTLGRGVLPVATQMVGVLNKMMEPIRELINGVGGANEALEVFGLEVLRVMTKVAIAVSTHWDRQFEIASIAISNIGVMISNLVDSIINGSFDALEKAALNTVKSIAMAFSKIASGKGAAEIGMRLAEGMSISEAIGETFTSEAEDLKKTFGDLMAEVTEGTKLPDLANPTASPLTQWLQMQLDAINQTIANHLKLPSSQPGGDGDGADRPDSAGTDASGGMADRHRRGGSPDPFTQASGRFETGVRGPDPLARVNRQQLDEQRKGNKLMREIRTSFEAVAQAIAGTGDELVLMRVRR